MKKIIFLVTALMGFGAAHAQKDAPIDPWKEMPEGFEPFSRGMDGTIEVEVTNQGKDMEDCKNKAKYQAVYKILFFGYNEANNIPKAESICPTGEALYNEKLEFFTQFFKSSATSYILDAKPSSRKPASKIDKKSIRASILVKVDVRNLTKALESQKIIKSMSDLGFKPSILIVPSDPWLEKNNLIKKVQNQGKEDNIRDYQTALNNDQFRATMNVFQNKYADAFELKDLVAQIDEIKLEEQKNNAKPADAVDKESSTEIFDRVIKADIWIAIDFIIEPLDGAGQRSKVTISLEAKEPSTQSKVMVAMSSPIEGYTRDLSKLIQDGLLASINDLRPKLVKYFSDMTEMGLKGSVELSLAESTDFNLKTLVSYNGKNVPLGEVTKSCCRKNGMKVEPGAKNQEPFKVVTSSDNKAEYTVYIPFWTQNIDGDREKNNYSTYAENVRQTLDAAGYVAEVNPKGNSRCSVRITGKK